MKEIGYLGILLGAVGAVLLIFVTELVRAAFRTRTIAFRANAYLSSSFTELLEHKEFVNISFVAKKWNDERSTFLQSTGHRTLTPDDVRSLEEIDKKFKDSIKSAYDSSEKVNAALADILKVVRSPGLFDARIAMLRQAEDDIRRNVSLISDDDGAHLGWVAAHHLVTYRQKILSALAQIQLLMCLAKQPQVDLDAAKLAMESMMKSLIDALRVFFPLKDIVEHIRKMNLFRLCLYKLRD